MLLGARGYGRHTATTALRSSTGGRWGGEVAKVGHGGCFYKRPGTLRWPSVGTVPADGWGLPAVQRVCLSAPRYKNTPSGEGIEWAKGKGMRSEITIIFFIAGCFISSATSFNYLSAIVLACK